MVKKEISGLKRMLEKLASGHVVEKLGSEVSNMLEVVKAGDTLLLNSPNTNYSFGALHRVFRKVFKKIDIREKQIRDTLILGFGTGSVATILREELGLDCSITAVEKDPGVLMLGKKYFNTDRFTDLKVIEADAVKFIASAPGSYDLIVVDVYIDFEVPASCETMEFIINLKKCLKPGGMVLFNKMIYNHKAGEEADELEKKFKTLDGKTSVIKVRESVLNKMIVYENRSSIQYPVSSNQYPVTSNQYPVTSNQYPEC